MKGFSIIICSHNPNEEIFNRLLNALENLDAFDIQFEVIIIDNNSSPPLASKVYVSDFLKKNVSVSVTIERNPGLTSARMAGIKRAKYDWLVFFDDDNEPYYNYLHYAKIAIHQFPNVGAWGPGQIKVEFENKKKLNWIENKKALFQEISMKHIEIDNKPFWCNCYPNGTGLIIKKEIAIEYLRLVENNVLTLTDRIGKSLNSGGDTQMVLLSIKLGYSAGLFPELKLNHLISSKKINMLYILRQAYMTSSCFVKAFNEIQFHNNQIPIVLEGNKRIVNIFILSLRSKLTSFEIRGFLIDLYSRLGEINARYIASNNEHKPFILRIFEKLINV